MFYEEPSYFRACGDAVCNLKLSETTRHLVLACLKLQSVWSQYYVVTVPDIETYILLFIMITHHKKSRFLRDERHNHGHQSWSNCVYWVSFTKFWHVVMGIIYFETKIKQHFKYLLLCVTFR